MNDDVRLAQQANDLLASYRAGQILLETSVFYETAFVLTSRNFYDLPRSVTANALRNILHTGLFACDEALLLATLQLYETTKFDFVGCLLAAQVQLERAKTLLTFDQPLLKKLKTL